jgi:hypothetical protein
MNRLPNFIAINFGRMMDQAILRWIKQHYLLRRPAGLASEVRISIAMVILIFSSVEE